MTNVIPITAAKDKVKAATANYIDWKTVGSVIAAGAILAGGVWALRKVGMKKAAAVVAKAK